MIRKAALQIGVSALLALIAWNAYLAIHHVKRLQTIATLTRGAGSTRILSVFVQGSLIGRSANNHWSRSWSLWLDQSRLRWNALSVCANRGIAIAHSSSSIQTKARATWMRFGTSRLRYPQRRATIT